MKNDYVGCSTSTTEWMTEFLGIELNESPKTNKFTFFTRGGMLHWCIWSKYLCCWQLRLICHPCMSMNKEIELIFNSGTFSNHTNLSWLQKKQCSSHCMCCFWSALPFPNILLPTLNIHTHKLHYMEQILRSFVDVLSDTNPRHTDFMFLCLVFMQ